MMTPHTVRNAFLVDGSAIHDANDYFSRFGGSSRPRTDFVQLHAVLEEVLAQHDWGSSRGLLLCSIDERSSASRNFVEAVRKTPFDVEPVDFRELYVSLPPGVRPQRREDEEDSGQKPMSSLAPRINYILGRMSRHPDPQVLVVSHCYEMKWALETLKRQCPQARVGMAFFHDLWDFRFKDYGGNLKQDSPIEFFELDDYVDRLFGVKSDTPSVTSEGKESPIDKY